MKRLITASVVLAGVLGLSQVHAQQQTNQAPPLAEPGEPGTVQCYIMARGKDGKFERTIATMYGKNNPGGAMKNCAELK